MITINKMSKEFDEVQQYLMTVSPAIVSMKDVADGEKITVSGTLEFTDAKDGGKSVDILSIITPDDKVYSCQSATFKRSLADIENIMHGKEFTIIKRSGKTKNDRPYIDCELDVASLRKTKK